MYDLIANLSLDGFPTEKAEVSIGKACSYDAASKAVHFLKVIIIAIPLPEPATVTLDLVKPYKQEVLNPNMSRKAKTNLSPSSN